MTPIRFIAGSGRSGTTWVQDALASANKLRPIFEPLHPYVTDVGRRYAHRALSADEEHAELKEFLLSVCAGRGPRLWTQYRQQRRWLLPPPAEFSSRQDAGRTSRHWAKFLREFPRMTAHGLRREPLIKCIRANLMLPWIARQLPCRIVFIVRHPGAVIESELRGRWNAKFAVDRFRDDQRLHELTADRYRSLLSKSVSTVEALAIRWVIENQWVIEVAAMHGITVIHYEHLRSTQGDAWAGICAALQLESLPDRGTLVRPSQQSGSRRKAVPLAQAERPRWMRALTVEQSAEIEGVLKSVGFDGYVMNDPNPVNTMAVGASHRQAGAHR